MKIGLVKLYRKSNEKQRNWFKTIITNLVYNYRFDTNKVWNKENNIFYVMNFSEKSQEKLRNLLRKNQIDCVIVENSKNINYKILDGKEIMKYLLKEIIEKIRKETGNEIPEISICVNTYNEETKTIIKELSSVVKVVNVVTNNDNFFNFEKELEQKNIFITVSKNKRKALKKAELMINFDFKNIKDFNLNGRLIIINLNEEILYPKSFEGIIINSIELTTKKRMRIIAENPNLSKAKLIEKEIIEMSNREKIKEYVRLNRIEIKSFNNKDMQYEFERMKIREN